MQNTEFRHDSHGLPVTDTGRAASPTPQAAAFSPDDFRVTVVVPVYNVEAYMAECAESLFAQTYHDIEYVFCDDCTPDASMSVLRRVIARYPERASHVTIIHNEKNSGLGATRRHLVSHVRTPYFMIADSDDRLPLTAVETLVQVMKTCQTDIVDGAYAEYSRGQLSRPVLPSHSSRRRYMHSVLCQNLVQNRVWGRLYRRAVLDMVSQPFIPGIDYGEDLCFTARLMATATRSWTDDVVYHYRTDNMSSYTKNISRRSLMSYLRASAVIYAYYRERRQLSLALETGMLNVYRECRKTGVAFDEADAITGYVPRSFVTRMARRMLCGSQSVFALGNICYKILRALAARAI